MNQIRHFSPSQLIALTFAGLILAGALLLMLPFSSAEGSSLSFVDALFTATSASCVTGLIVVDTGTYFSTFGQLVIGDCSHSFNFCIGQSAANASDKSGRGTWIRV